MADLDRLQIDIVAQDKSSDTIDKISQSIKELGATLEQLNVSKVSSLANSLSKLASIGQSTRVTSKAIKDMGSALATHFSITSKKGIDDITEALRALYEAEKMTHKDSSSVTTDMYISSVEGVRKAIEAHYKYQDVISDTAAKVMAFMEAEKAAGNKVSLLGMQNEVQSYEKLKETLGSTFTDKVVANAESLDSFFLRLKEDVPEEAAFNIGGEGQSGSTKDFAAALVKLREYLEEARNSQLGFKEALAKQEPVAMSAAHTVDEYANKIAKLYTNMETYGGNAQSGLGGVVGFINLLNNANIPDLSGFVQATKSIKSEPAQETAKAVVDVATSADEATKEVEVTDRAIQQLARDSEDLKSILEGFQMPDLAKNLGISNYTLDIEKQYGRPTSMKPTGFVIPNFDDSAPERVNEELEQIKTTALALVEPFNEVKEQIMQMGKMASLSAQNVGQINQSVVNATTNVSQGFKQAIPAIQQAIEKAREYKKILSDMESGKITFDKDVFDALVKGYDEATKAVKKYKDELLGVEKKPKREKGLPTEGVLSNFVELGEGLERVSKQFDALAEKHIKVFKLLSTPLKMVAEEYKEKFEGMAEKVAEFRKNMQTHLAKLSQFWKRTMKTFTFMLVRKAITTIIKEVGTAVQSLALYSNAMGTAFNTDISQMVADFSYLGRSIVSVFAPLLNTIVPIIDAIVDRIATLISYIGMLFAALGGGTSFTKAKKNVTNYAESLDSASKSAKNLTMGIDELNILNDSKGGGSSKPYDNWADEWEEVDIPAWITDISNWLKDFWSKFFDPLKQAWDRAKQYLIDGFKTMLAALQSMFGSIIDDFLTMWNQEKTIRMFEQILRIVGDLMRVVRELAHNFEEAWNKGKIGLRILENLRDVASILVDHVRNVSYYMIEWAQGVSFDKILEAFEEMTNSAKRVADFIGGVFEDVAKRVLDYFEWSIEEATPHLIETISSIFDTFDFVSLRKNLDKIWRAFERLFKNIHTGTTNAIGNLGKMVARFTNSKTFTDFIQKVVYYTTLISKERVEKVLTGLGTAIVKLAESVVKFVSSDTFQKFLEAIAKWIDNHSVDQIAGILEKIAFAIGVFEFGAFTAEKLAGFFQFATTLTALKNLGTIAKHFSEIGEATGKAAPKITSFAQGFTTLGENIYLLPTKVVELKDKFLDLHNHIGLFTKALGSVAVGFAEFKLVQKNVENLALAIGGDDSKSLVGSILGLVATLGAAELAFIALLGVPAGVVAGLCVGAVAAIKGVQDAVNQINFEHMTDAIMTKGDTTVQQVAKWYSQATATVEENSQKWIDIERNLTQDRADIDEYSEAIKRLGIAFDSGVQLTVKSADTLTSKYESLCNSIENYIDDSTNSLIENLYAQRAFLEAQGMDVDAMVANILKGAEDEKRVLEQTVTDVRTAYQKYEDAVREHGEASQQAIDAWKAYEEAGRKASEETERFCSEIEKIDTTTAAEEIEKLGEKLDFSKYTNNAEGLSQAKTDIENAVTEISAKYSEEMGKVEQNYSDRVDEFNEYLRLHPMALSKEDQAKVLQGIERDYNEQKETLISAQSQALNFISENLTEKLAEVAKKAEEDWDSNNPLIQMAAPNKQEYILGQLQSYVDNMVTTGLGGTMEEAYTKLYQDLPGRVQPDVVSSMQGIIDNEKDAFYEASFMGSGILYDDQYNMLTNILGAVDSVDYDSPAQTFADKNYNAFYQHMQGVDYVSLGREWNDLTGGAILSNSQIFEDANRIASGEGAAAFNEEYLKFHKDNKEIIDSLSGVGDTYGTSIIDGLNGAIEEKADTTEPFIQTWFKKINDWIHDNTNLPFGSPNKKTKEYGEDTVKGFNLGITTSATTSIQPINTWFIYINAAIKNGLKTVNDQFTTFFNGLLRGDGIDVVGNITILFNTITTSMLENLTIMGDMLLTTTIPEFIANYLTPAFEQIRAWFSEEAMAIWWEEDLLTWFTDDKWTTDIFAPMGEFIKDHWKNFVEWWDKSIKEWWQKHLLEPWFKKVKWDTDVFNPLKKNIQEHWKQFIEWWDKSIDNWWDEHLIHPWFTEQKWDGDVFNPLRDNIKLHFSNFVVWWDTSMTSWWVNHVKPYFTKERWSKQFDNISEVERYTFENIANHIREAMSSAKDAVTSACSEMQGAIASVMSAIEALRAAIESLGDLGGSVSVNIPEFAAGGFPSGDLFIANEAGAELVGTVGGRTAVASNQEITGIADAVYSTGNQESALLRELINLAQNMLDKDPVVIGDREIARMANNGQSQLGMSIIT